MPELDEAGVERLIAAIEAKADEYERIALSCNDLVEAVRCLAKATGLLEARNLVYTEQWKPKENTDA